LPKLAETLLAVREGTYLAPVVPAADKPQAAEGHTGPTKAATAAMLAATTRTKTQIAMTLT
jgi:hypothetical protein